MDIPITLLHWEVFLPEQYKVTDFHGDAISATLVPPAFQEISSIGYGYGGGIGNGNGASVDGIPASDELASFPLASGQLGGVVGDPSGAVVPNATIIVTNSDTGFSTSTVSDGEGRWIVSNITSGRIKIRADAPGFKSMERDAMYNADRPAHFSFPLSVGTMAETVTVEAGAVSINGRDVNNLYAAPKSAPQQQAASANVVNLQRRVAGVLPVAIDIPRAGASFQFVRPLVLGEETKVTFNYKSR